jgi:hypothetical protein
LEGKPTYHFPCKPVAQMQDLYWLIDIGMVQ